MQIGIDLNPIPEKPAGKRGRTKKGKVRALLDRLTDHKQEFLRFAYNWDVPFTNNEAERSIRGIKVKQKVSGCFRSKTCAEEYATIMSFLTTARKNGVAYGDFDCFAVHSLTARYDLPNRPEISANTLQQNVRPPGAQTRNGGRPFGLPPFARHDSICFPRKPATVWHTFCSVSPTGSDWSSRRTMTQPMRSPSARIGAATPR